MRGRFEEGRKGQDAGSRRDVATETRQLAEVSETVAGGATTVALASAAATAMVILV